MDNNKNTTGQNTTQTQRPAAKTATGQTSYNRGRQPSKNEMDNKRIYIITGILIALILAVIIIIVCVAKGCSSETTGGGTTSDTTAAAPETGELIIDQGSNNAALNYLVVVDAEHTFTTDISGKVKSLFTVTDLTIPKKYKLGGSDLWLLDEARLSFVTMMNKLATDKSDKPNATNVQVLATGAYNKNIITGSNIGAVGAGVEVKLNIIDSSSTSSLKSDNDIYGHLKEIAPTYGWIWVEDSNSGVGYSVFRFVGLRHAKYMTDHNVASVAAYVADLKANHNTLATALVLSDGSLTYYQVKAAGENAETRYLTKDGYSPQYSLTNEGGYIITLVKNATA